MPNDGGEAPAAGEGVAQDTLLGAEGGETPAGDEKSAEDVAAEKVAAEKVAAEKVAADAGKPGDKEGEGKSKDGKADDDAGAPEIYEAFKLPEGMPEGMELDAKALELFQPIAKEMNLSQADAQKLVDFQAKSTLAAQQASFDAWETMKGEWANGTKADKEIGGEKLEENLKVAQLAIKKFGSPELTNILNATGMGNHLELVRFMFNVGKELAEDGVSIGGAHVAPDQKTQAQILYPSAVKT